MRRVLDIALKDLRVLSRDRPSLFWVFGWPLVFAFFFGTIIGGGGGGGRSSIPIAVVVEDSSAAARSLAARLDSSDAFRVTRLGRAEARDAVRRGELTAYVRIEEGYGESAGLFGPQETPIRVGIDPARRAEAELVKGLVTRATFQELQESFADPERMQAQLRQSREEVEGASDLTAEQKRSLTSLFSELDDFYGSTDTMTFPGEGGAFGSIAVQLEDVAREEIGRPRSAFEITFPSAILWGLIAVASTFAVSLVLERMDGTLLRLRTSPAPRIQILLGKGAACFLASLAVIAVLLAVARLFLGVRIGSPGLLAVAIVCTAACFVGVMMLISTLGKTPRAVGGAGWAILLVLAMLGGGMIPLIAMPEWMQTVSHVSPVKWGILALEGGIWRGFSPAEMVLPCAILLAIGLAGLLVGLRVYTWTET